MVARILTVVPLLALSGLFFAAGIFDGGILFLVFALGVAWLFLRARPEVGATSREEALEIEARSGPGPGAGGTMAGG
jgi:hypothetical protein